MDFFSKISCVAVLASAAVNAVFAQETYKVVSGSSVQISGTSTLSNWVVKSGEVSGEMTFVRSGKGGAGAKIETVKTARAVLAVSTIKSEKGETMDNKMYGALKSESHPDITFVLSQPFRIPATGSGASASGIVQLAGVTKPMTFNLEVTYEGSNVHVRGKKPLKLSEFDIEPPTAMFGQIETGDEIEVAFDLVFGK